MKDDDKVTPELTDQMPDFGPPDFIVPIGEQFECPCGYSKLDTAKMTWVTSMLFRCPGCKRVVAFSNEVES
jgi:hypothetical protein